MAKNNQPIAKRCKTLGISPAVMGYDKKNTTRNSAAKPRKKGEYATQLQEKQKAKFIYGVMEKQFHNYYLKAEKMAGKTGENLLSLLERRLDNVVFRMGLAHTRFSLYGRPERLSARLYRADAEAEGWGSVPRL